MYTVTLRSNPVAPIRELPAMLATKTMQIVITSIMAITKTRFTISTSTSALAMTIITSVLLAFVPYP